jgi:magnesium transporter
MAKLSKRKSLRAKVVPGSSPGTLIAPSQAAETKIDIIAYNADTFLEESDVKPQRIPEVQKKWPNLWINISGLSNVETLRHVGEFFSVHDLALEDVLNIPQRPKLEVYDEHIFLILRMARFLSESQLIDIEQISLFLGDGFVLTIQERPGDNLDAVRARLRKGGPRMRSSGSGYLAYAIIDAIIDGYFPVLESYGRHLDDLEERLILSPQRETMAAIYTVRRELLALRRIIWPLKEAISGLNQDHDQFIQEGLRTYFRDCQDHIIQILEILENYRELASGLMEFYLSSVSYKMNEVIKVLTLIATVFMPLSFIAGVYGMNFSTKSSFNMPELHWEYGYIYFWGLVIVMVAGFLYFFIRKGWLSE